MASEGDSRTVAHELRLTQPDAPPAFFHGFTMQPHLVEGDYVLTEPISASDVRLGDVVTYRFEDQFPTRRVVARDERARVFTFMGDSIPGRREYLVSFDDALARVVRRRRGDAWLATTDVAWRRQTIRVMVIERSRRSRWLGPVRWATRPLRR